MTATVGDVNVPVFGAPMAGGPSTPELAAAITGAGGLGFLAGGLISAETLAEQLTSARKLTSGPLGVNLFVPQPSADTPAAWSAYAAALTGDARRYGVAVGAPAHGDDGWAAKLDVLHDLRPDVVSFTFGIATAQEIAAIRSVGVTTVATVTSVAEARLAAGRGVDAIIAQGPKAGGHRATFDAAQRPPADPLANLLGAVVAAVDVPVIAAGGLMTAADVQEALAAGAAAAQLGTAFLLADEAGTNSVHRRALGDPAFGETVVTRAFTGRYARALRNRFTDAHDDEAPGGFPEVALMTAPLAAAAAKAGDADGVPMWAGTGFRMAAARPAADIVAALDPAGVS